MAQGMLVWSLPRSSVKIHRSGHVGGKCTRGGGGRGLAMLVYVWEEVHKGRGIITGAPISLNRSWLDIFFGSGPTTCACKRHRCSGTVVSTFWLLLLFVCLFVFGL